MTTLSKLCFLLASLIVVSLSSCADNPTRMNVQQQLPIQVQKTAN